MYTVVQCFKHIPMQSGFSTWLKSTTISKATLNRINGYIDGEEGMIAKLTLRRPLLFCDLSADRWTALFFSQASWAPATPDVSFWLSDVLPVIFVIL